MSRFLRSAAHGRVGGLRVSAIEDPEVLDTGVQAAAHVCFPVSGALAGSGAPGWLSSGSGSDHLNLCAHGGSRTCVCVVCWVLGEPRESPVGCDESLGAWMAWGGGVGWGCRVAIWG